MIGNNQAVSFCSSFCCDFIRNKLHRIFRIVTASENGSGNDGFRNSYRLRTVRTVQIRIRLQYVFICRSGNSHIRNQAFLIETRLIKVPILRGCVAHGSITIGIMRKGKTIPILLVHGNILDGFSRLMFSCLMDLVCLIVIHFKVFRTAKNRTSVLRQITSDDDTGAGVGSQNGGGSK